MAGLNIPIINKVNYDKNQLVFIVDQFGDLIAWQYQNGQIIWFPAGATDNGLTATAGGGQANALPLNYRDSRVTTVATAADSVVLPVSQAGMQLVVVNAAAANSMNVFPATGESINALAANTAFAVAAGKTAQFTCINNGQWHAILSA